MVLKVADTMPFPLSYSDNKIFKVAAIGDYA
jgi:hypothetical protein